MPAALEKNMGVIVHQHPGIDGTFSFRNLLAQMLQEIRLVFLVSEDRGPIDSSHHDVVQSTRNI
jgi:hypothetical protein